MAKREFILRNEVYIVKNTEVGIQEFYNSPIFICMFNPFWEVHGNYQSE